MSEQAQIWLKARLNVLRAQRPDDLCERDRWLLECPSCQALELDKIERALAQRATARNPLIPKE